MTVPRWLKLTGAFSALLLTALGAPILTWWLERDELTTITHVVTTTATGTDATARTLVPDLTVRIGQKEVPALYTHVIQITSSGPRAIDVPVGIIFGSDVVIYGKLLQEPTPIHNLDCQDIPRGLECVLGPLDESQQLPYKIMLATDMPGPPDIVSTGDNIQVASLQSFAGAEQFRLEQISKTLSYVLTALTFLTAFLFLYFTLRREPQGVEQFLVDEKFGERPEPGSPKINFYETQQRYDEIIRELAVYNDISRQADLLSATLDAAKTHDPSQVPMLVAQLKELDKQMRASNERVQAIAHPAGKEKSTE